MDAGPQLYNITLLGIFNPISASDIPIIIGTSIWMIVCLLISAISSASENAFFSHKESDLEELSERNSRTDVAILKLLSNPKRLLATLLLMNSLINIAFIISSLFLFDKLLNSADFPLVKLLLDTVLVTLVILIFGEVVPKVYATQNYKKTAQTLVFVIRSFVWLLWPFTTILEKLANVLERKTKVTGPNITTEELSQAIELTADKDDATQEKEILKGIVNMSNIQVKQIMRSRMDVIAVPVSQSFHEILKIIRHNGYSRMPVYKETLDQVIGVLNVKSLLPHLQESDTFNWQAVIYPPYFVPENKSIDDLLHELQQKRLHMAIVVDEFGGTSGLVTFEDLLEEVFGELNDEFDDHTTDFSQIDELTYIFEGKTLIVDFLREIELPLDYFEDLELESDTLAGLLTEQLAKIPKRGEKIKVMGIQFIVEAADPKKVKKVKVILPHNEEAN